MIRFVRSLLLIFLCFALFHTASAQSSELEIVEIDPRANTFTGTLNGQFRTFRVRPAVEVTVNGLKATFVELEPGMKVKVTSAEPGIATRLVATGLRIRKPDNAAGSLMNPRSQPSRQVNATIPANSPDAFPIGDVQKGTKIALSYGSGKWKSWGRISTSNPDDENPEGGEVCRLVISLPSKNGKGGEVLAIVPPNTRKRPFVFDVQADYPGLVLRINDKEGSFSGNPGSVEYSVKILPPVR